MSPLPDTDDLFATTWDASIGAFVLSDGRSASLFPSSQLLLRMYLSNTAAICTYRPAHINPFVTHVLPLATTDDLMMNAVLALAGAHYTSGRLDTVSPEMYRDTYRHYSLTLQGLKTACMASSDWSAEKRIRVLLVLVLLAHVEAIRGDDSGSIYPHLRVGWHLVQQLQLTRDSRNRGERSLEELEGFVLESYSYLALVSKIVPDDTSTGRFVADDHFMTNLSYLREYPTFGAFFEYCLELSEKIPVIQSLARSCLEEWRNTLPLTKPTRVTGSENENSPATNPNPSPTPLQTRVTTLITWLEAWQPPPPLHSDSTSSITNHDAAANVWRLALLIYLKATCLPPSTASHQVGAPTLPLSTRHYPLPTPSTLQQIDSHITHILDLGLPLMLTPYGATLLYPLLIASTCFRTEAQQTARNKIADDERAAVFLRIGEVEKLRALQRLLWREQPGGRGRYYGPFGLELVLRESGLNLSVA